MEEKKILDFLRSLSSGSDDGFRVLAGFVAAADKEETSAAAETATKSEDCEESPATPPEEDTPDSEHESEATAEETESAPESEAEADTADDSHLLAEFRRHLAASLVRLDGYRSGRRIDEATWREVFGLLLSIVGEAACGNIATGAVETLLRAVRYERDIDLARREGEVTGRNARIEEALATPRRDDGVPALQGNHGGTAGRKPRSIFDLADEAR